jgi:hypothetical protein
MIAFTDVLVRIRLFNLPRVGLTDYPAVSNGFEQVERISPTIRMMCLDFYV